VAVAVVLAAGKGERLGCSQPKAFIPVAGRQMLEWSIDALRSVKEITQIVVALPAGYQAPNGTVGVSGGSTRSSSVSNALALIDKTEQTVLIHDAARPLLSPETVKSAIDAFDTSNTDCLVVAAPMADTVKQVDESGRVVKTLDRSQLIAVQTPQIFKYQTLSSAIQGATGDRIAKATDDASLVELSGGSVATFIHTASNFKVTTVEDLKAAECLLLERSDQAQ